MKKAIFSILFLVGSFSQVLAQTYEGTEFWFGVLENLFPSKSIKMMVVAQEKAKLDFEVPAQSFSTSYSVNAGTTIMDLNKSLLYPSSPAGASDNKGAHVLSDKPVRLYVLNEDAFSSDASPIVPFDKFLRGEKYITQSLPGASIDGSTFVVVSTEDNSEFSITPSAKTVSGFIANSTFFITLDKGETISVKADNEGDLSGSIIESRNGCDRFVVFSGSKCSQSEYNSSSCTGCDHLYTHLLPVSHYGDTFYLAPFANQGGNYVAKITASQNATDVFIDDVLITTLNSGNSFEYRPIAPTFKKSCIITSKPAMVYQYLNSRGCNLEPNGKGDPSMLLIPDKSKWTTEANFGIFNTSNVNEHYINIVAHKDDLGAIVINADVPYTTSNDTFLMCHDIGRLTIKCSDGNFSLSSTKPFYSYVYSVGNNESIAYLTGAKVFPFESDFSIEPQKVCFDDQPVQLSILSDSIVVSEWIFGDGTGANGSNSVNHTYQNGGVYNAKAILKLASTTCSNDTIDIPITVLPPISFKGLKDSVVCPGEKITYRLISNLLLNYTWQDGAQGSIREISEPGSYVITATDTNGCFKTDSFTVSDSGCFDKNITLFNTITPNNDGLNDVWEFSHTGYSSIRYTIFNRWGIELFTGDALKNEWWNGNVQNAKIKCVDGTYYYHVVAKVKRTGAEENTYGVITLIR